MEEQSLEIIGIIISELKDSRLSVNSIKDELWFTENKTGKTLKVKIK